MERHDRWTLLVETLATDGASRPSRDPPVAVDLTTNSGIVASNEDRLWAARHLGLESFVRKNRGPHRVVGRELCDLAQERFTCSGFFSTDELPRDGLTRVDRGAIRRAVGAEPGDGVLLYAYEHGRSAAIDNLVFLVIASFLKETARRVRTA